MFGSDAGRENACIPPVLLQAGQPLEGKPGLADPVRSPQARPARPLASIGPGKSHQGCELVDPSHEGAAGKAGVVRIHRGREQVGVDAGVNLPRTAV